MACTYEHLHLCVCVGLAHPAGLFVPDNLHCADKTPCIDGIDGQPDVTANEIEGYEVGSYTYGQIWILDCQLVPIGQGNICHQAQQSGTSDGMYGNIDFAPHDTPTLCCCP